MRLMQYDGADGQTVLDRDNGVTDDPEAANAVAARHQAIIDLANRAGSVTVDQLAERFGVTPQTIRRDLNLLARRTMLSRVHGGAIVTSGVHNIAYDARRSVATGAKSAIGRVAAALIPDGASVFINIGTTTEAVAGNLAHRRDLMVISNNLNVVDILSHNDAIDLVTVGGQVRQSDRAIVGPLAMEFIRTFKVDFAVIGASAVEPDGSLLDFAIDEVQVTQTIVKNARQVILVADASKVGRAAPVRIGHLDAIDYFVTDRITQPDLRAICERLHIQLLETSTDADEPSSTALRTE